MIEEDERVMDTAEIETGERLREEVCGDVAGPAAAVGGGVRGSAVAADIEAEEREHLEEVLEQVRAALARARGLAGRTRESHEEAGRHLAESRGELAPEEAHLSAYELNRMDAQAALAATSQGRLEKLLDAPYFARVDFAEGEGAGEGGPDAGSEAHASAPAGEAAASAAPGALAVQSTYIGRFAFTWERRAVVSDWRSPVASLFYDFEPGPAFFEAPGGRRDGTLARKRQIAIEDGRLRYAADSASGVRDEVLVCALGRTSDAKMHDIVVSIQREQNAVIRDERPGTLVIQGVAGSGKTSIALHRVAYLLYRQKDRLNSRSVAILSPSRVFSDYISGVLPELGEEPPRQWDLYSLAAHLLAGIAKVGPRSSFPDEPDGGRAQRARAKGTEAFAAALTGWLDGHLEATGAEEGVVAALFEPRDLAVGSTVAPAAWLSERFYAYASVPFKERLDLVAADALDLSRGKTFGRYGRACPTRRELAGRLLRMMRAKNPLALYRRYLAETGQSALLKVPAKGVVEWEDAFPLALCALAFEGTHAFSDCAGVRHLVIDEMQDLTPVQHEAIARLFRCDRTILGDVNQLVDDRAPLTPDAVAAHYPGARVVCLMRSYRSTLEITELANRVRPVAGLIPAPRHGKPPLLARCGNTAGVLAAVGAAIERWRRTDRRTLGIIAKSDFLAARYAELLAREHEVALLTDETDAYPGGIVVASVRLAKGLEFDEAVLLDVDARQYATEVDRNLLYVAITRAMHALTVLYRDVPSPFLA